jgi:RecA-family ATPase
VSTNGKAGVPLDFDGEPTADSAQKIRKLEDIPNIRTMDVPPIDYIVTGLFARGTVTLWAGIGGCGKTFLAQSLALAVATGTTFLGRTTKQTPVLYLDYENPSYAVRDRLDLIAGERLAPNLHVWGTWLEQQPPPIGSELLALIAKETKPLLIVDPFRFAHGQDENDSTAMMAVMQRLRSYAAFGCAVVLLHHLAKAEGSTGRGSTCIRDHSDAAFVQEQSGETGLNHIDRQQESVRGAACSDHQAGL